MGKDQNSAPRVQRPSHVSFTIQMHRRMHRLRQVRKNMPNAQHKPRQGQKTTVEEKLCRMSAVLPHMPIKCNTIRNLHQGERTVSAPRQKKEIATLEQDVDKYKKLYSEYKEAYEEEKEKYNEKMLCRTVGGGFSIITVLIFLLPANALKMSCYRR